LAPADLDRNGLTGAGLDRAGPPGGLGGADLARAGMDGAAASTAVAVGDPALVRLADVVPAPASVRPAAGMTYTLTADATIRTTANADAEAVGRYLADLLRPATGYPLPVIATGPGQPDGGIALLLTPADPDTAVDDPAGVSTSGTGELAGTRALRHETDDLAGPADVDAVDWAGSAEGYRLDVRPDGVTIRAATRAGLFYGVQTLRQLLPSAVENATVQPGPWIMPGGRIADRPRFAYRGAMLDVSRHFFEVADVLRFVDHVARYKINHLHLHLTDDQGWRIAIDSWPRLATVGGATEVDGGPGGYYSQEQYRQIVAYAAAREITVVPEIDMPGHTNAALMSYGALSPDGAAPRPYTGIDVGFSTLSVESDLTYDFVDDVLGEIAALTPGPYLHIGGDEAFTLPPAEYATFMDRVQPIVGTKGKTVMGWHQLAAADGPASRVIQYWGTATADASVTAAVRQGARVVLSPGNRAYLDMKYTGTTPLGKDWAGLVEVRASYDWDPGSYLADVPTDAVLGVEAPLWTETIESIAQVEFMTFPRLPAIAEVAWSPASTRDWEAFRLRLAAQAPRWRASGINFYRSPQIPWPATPTPVPEQAPAAPPTGVPAGSPTRVVGPPTAEPAAGGVGPPDDGVPVGLG
jgi:hexosaminidase